MTRKIKKILLSGKMGSGKTSTARALQEWCWKNKWLVQTIKFAEPLYAMHDAVRLVAESYDIPMLEKDGMLLQMLGTNWGRHQFGDDVWVKACLKKVAHTVDFWNMDLGVATHAIAGMVTLGFDVGITPGMIIIDDCRFENEFTAFYDALRVRLVAPRDVRKGRCDSWRDNEEHLSEISLDKYEEQGRFDLTVNTALTSVEEVVSLILNVERPDGRGEDNGKR